MAFESFINVSAPASDLDLLTLEQLKDAVDVSGSTYDAKLKLLGARVSAAITAACQVEGDGINPPTLLKETVTETFRRQSFWANGAWPFADSEKMRHSLYLKRFPVASVISVVADGTMLDPSSYELRAADGALVRLSNDTETPWLNWKIVVSYSAGFASVPDDLALCAAQLAQILWWQSGRDPNQKQAFLEGVSRREWFANPHDGDLVPKSLLGSLAKGGYINRLV